MRQPVWSGRHWTERQVKLESTRQSEIQARLETRDRETRIERQHILRLEGKTLTELKVKLCREGDTDRETSKVRERDTNREKQGQRYIQNKEDTNWRQIYSGRGTVKRDILTGKEDISDYIKREREDTAHWDPILLDTFSLIASRD